MFDDDHAAVVRLVWGEVPRNPGRRLGGPGLRASRAALHPGYELIDFMESIV
jgi:hypothetical protein